MIDWRVVGRNEELEWVVAALAGDPGSVVVAGEAGIGKSRLAREAIRLIGASRHPPVVVSANATASGSGLELGALAHLLPDGDGGDGPAALLRAMIADLHRRARDERLLLFVDDAHHLDEVSATLLVHLAREPWASLLVTVRSGAATPDAVAALWKDRWADRLDLQPLSRADVDHLVGLACGGPIDTATADTLWAATRGNVLYLRELVHDALETGRLQQRAGVWRLVEPLAVPRRLREVVDGRLGGLSALELGALELVAAAGDIGLDLLLEAVRVAVVESLERKGLLEVGEDGSRRPVRLAHPVYAEALIDGMPAIRRRRVEGRAAELLARTGLRRQSDLARVVSLRVAAGAHPDVVELEHAAVQAYRAFDLTAAERLARDAVRIAPRHATDALLMLAKLHRWRGEYAKAEELLASVDPATLPDERVRARHAVTRAENLFRGLGLADPAIVLLREQAASLSPEWSTWLLAHIAEFELFAGNVERAVELAEPLLGKEPPSVGTVHAAVALTYARGRAGRYEDALAASERGMAAAASLSDAVSEDPAALWIGRGLALVDAGRIDDAEAMVRLVRPLAEGIPRGLAWIAVTVGRLRLMQGDLPEATRLAREAAVVFGDLGDDVAARVAWAGVARAAAQAADVTAATEALDRARALNPGGVRLLECELGWATAWTKAARGEHSAARHLLICEATAAGDGGQRGVELAMLHDAARLGASGEVATRVADLAAVVDGAIAPLISAHTDALAAGDAAALAAVSERFEAAGARLWAAEAAAAQAEVLTKSGRRREAAAAGSRARVLGDTCGARTPGLAGLADPVPLTAREQEIAALAASGLSSPEIAEKLVLSVRTVNNHLQRVYAKLGVAGRAELAR